MIDDFRPLLRQPWGSACRGDGRRPSCTGLHGAPLPDLLARLAHYHGVSGNGQRSVVNQEGATCPSRPAKGGGRGALLRFRVPSPASTGAHGGGARRVPARPSEERIEYARLHQAVRTIGALADSGHPSPRTRLPRTSGAGRPEPRVSRGMGTPRRARLGGIEGPLGAALRPDTSDPTRTSRLASAQGTIRALRGAVHSTMRS